MAPTDNWFEVLKVPENEDWGISVQHVGESIYIIHEGDKPDAPRAIVPNVANIFSHVAEEEPIQSLYQRIHRLLVASLNPPVKLPVAWTPFHHDNLISFFAAPYGVDSSGLRWLAEIHPLDTKDAIFWKLTTSEDQVDLTRFKPDYEVFMSALEGWDEAFSLAAAEFEVPSRPPASKVEPVVDLDATTFGSVTRYLTYTGWLKQLTHDQRQFVESMPNQSLKLRGPAGSGKTLTLELKALHELYRARKEDRQIRILFATHSWAVAEQIDCALEVLDESGGTPEIEIYPLLEIARDRVRLEKRLESGVELLGQDSLSGRRLQFRRLGSLIDVLARGDWFAYREGASAQFASRIMAKDGSPEREALLWDLTLEFSQVMGSERILPGKNGEKRYLGIERYSWMMPLHTEADKRFVFHIYTRYLRDLENDRFITVDQVVADFLSYLETFMWNLLRETDGYDYVFVDELHLFTEQERLALNLLTRPSTEYPRLFMALDPRQSPSAVYTGSPVDGGMASQSGEAELALGKISSVDLECVYRFTPEILRLVQHIHRSYPALDFGPDWQLDPDVLTTSVANGEVPVIFLCSSRTDEANAVAKRALEVLARTTPGERTAVIVVDPLQLPSFAQAVRQHATRRVVVIESREDVDTALRYSKRGLIVGAAEYLAGLQFDNVIVGGFPTLGTSPRRHELSLLYLAVSRAARSVELYVNSASGGIPPLLTDAAETGVARLGN